MKKGIWSFLVAVIVSLMTIDFGYAAWNHVVNSYSGGTSVAPTLSAKAPVAKVVGSSTTYFSDFGAALKYAYGSSSAESIYLIPSLNNDLESTNDWNKTQATLTKTHAANSSYSYDGKTYAQYIVNSNDSLYIPYTGDTIFDSYEEKTLIIDNTLANQKANLTNELIIDDGVLLDIRGAFQVGGAMGQTNTNNTGLEHNVTGNYAQISMKQNSKILYSGSTDGNNVYGYIKEYDENSKSDGIDIINSSSFMMPLALYDWPDGNWATSIKDDYFPMLVFDFPNVQTKLRTYYGSTLNVKAGVYVSIFGHMTQDIALVSTGSSSFLQMQGSGYVEFDWDPKTTVNVTTNNESRAIALTENERSTATSGNSTKEKMVLASNVTMNNLAVKISSYDMTTADKEMPLSYKIDLTVKSGYTCTIPSAISAKLLPGAKVEIEEGATVDLKGKMLVYKNFTEQIRKSGQRYTTKFNVSSGGPGAQLINNGTFNIYGSFGGPITTTNTTGTAHTIFQSGSVYSHTVKEGTSYTSRTTLVQTIDYTVTYADVTEQAIGNIYYTGEYQNGVYFEGKGTDFPSTNTSETDDDGNAYTANYWVGEKVENSYVISVSFDLKNDPDNSASFTVNFSDGTSSTITGNGATTFPVKEGVSFTITNLTEVESITIDGNTYTEGATITPTANMSVSVVVSPTYYTLTIETYNSKVTLTSIDGSTIGTFEGEGSWPSNKTHTQSVKKGTQFKISYEYTGGNRFYTEKATIDNSGIDTSKTYTVTKDMTIIVTKRLGG